MSHPEKLSFLLSFLFVGCTDPPLGLDPKERDDSAALDTAETGDSELLDSGEAELEIGPFEPCDLVPGSGDGAAECAALRLPLDHARPEAGSLDAMVKRLPARTEPEAAQLWVLHGGPGASAIDDLASLPAGLRSSRPDIAIYAVDHRGIGASGKLECPEQESAPFEGGEIAPDGFGRHVKVSSEGLDLYSAGDSSCLENRAVTLRCVH